MINTMAYIPENLVINPGFEDGVTSPNNWKSYTQNGITPVWDNTVAHTGTHSMKIYIPGTTDVISGSVTSDFIPAGVGITYILSAWGKSEGVGGTIPPAIRISEYDINKTWLRQFTVNFPIGTADWNYQQGKFITGANTAYLAVYANIYGGYGTFWVDDVSLVSTGSISCSSTPTGAQIWMDDSNTGLLTPAILNDVGAGTHTITFKKANYNDCPQDVVVTGGATSTASCTLLQMVGLISCSTTPAGAQILLDGIDTGQITPATLNNVVIGNHLVTFKLTGYQDCVGAVTVTSGGTSFANCTLQIITPSGSVSFTSTPKGANIYIDGMFQNSQTPATLTGIPTGNHTYKLTLAGFSDNTGAFVVQQNQQSNINVVMKPIVQPSPASNTALMVVGGAVIGLGVLALALKK